MKTLGTRLVTVLAALLLVAGLAPPAAAAPAPASVPAAPAAPDPGDMLCIATLLPGLSTGTARNRCLADQTRKAPKRTKDAVSSAAKALAGTVIEDMAKALADFTDEMIKTGFSWWLSTDSVQVKDSGVLGDPESKDPTKQISLHALMAGIGVGISIILAMFAGIRTMVQRKGQPLAQMLQGLIINILVSVAGVAIVDALLISSDTLSEAILKVGFGTEDGAPSRMAAILLPMGMANPMGLLVIALIVLLVGAIQLILLFLRQSAVPIQALLLPIAGSGQMGGQNTQQWLGRLATAIMTIICYKPMAALIIAVGFVEIENAPDLINFIRGVVTLVLSVVALKAMLALFAPLGLQIGGAAASAGGLGNAVGAAASMLGARMGASSGGGSEAPTSVESHAAHMDRHGPASQSQSGGQDNNQGDTAVRQQSGNNVPQQSGPSDQQQGQDAAPAEAGQEAATNTANTAATTGKAAGGPVAVTIVAAESAKGAVDKSANTISGRE